MKIDPLDAHDRYTYFQKQDFSIAECCQDILNQRPFGDVPFYIFAHARTDDDGVTKRLIWQPRLTRPKPQTNSYLFRAISNTDMIEVIWLLPPREMWTQYDIGKVTESNLVAWSIKQFESNRNYLDSPHPDDISEERAKEIMKEIIKWKKFKRVT